MLRYKELSFVGFYIVCSSQLDSGRPLCFPSLINVDENEVSLLLFLSISAMGKIHVRLNLFSLCFGFSLTIVWPKI
jgi:hypothetical protein